VLTDELDSFIAGLETALEGILVVYGIEIKV
jgi:hypothetical protein